MKINEAVTLLQKQLLANQYPYSYLSELTRHLSITKESCGELEPWQESRLQYIIFLLQKDYPVEYIVHRALFQERYFYVNKDVLIPRFDSEKLVNWVLQLPIYHRPVTVIDIGTGSGALIISTILELNRITKSQHKFYATDISETALEVARKNAHQFQVTELIQFNSSMLPLENGDPLIPETKDVVIITNPPYIAEEHFIGLPSSVLYEPEVALRAQPTFLPALQDYIDRLQENEKTIHLAIEYNNNDGNMIQRFSTAMKVDLLKLLSL